MTHLDLLSTSDSTEHNFGEFLSLEGAIGNAADDLESSLDDGHAVVSAIVDESSNVLARHLGKLLLENVLEAGEDDHRLGLAVVRNDGKADNASALFGNGGSLLPWLRSSNVAWSVRHS